MLWTRVGYAGGAMPEPTYTNLGDHSEAIEIGFDPSKISYERLLMEFWKAHTPTAEPWSRQYRSAVFVHDDAQREVAERTRRLTQKRLGAKVHTAIEEAGTFWQAEGYHQKYNLRSDKALFAEVEAIYPDVDVLVRSTMAARLNAVVGGWDIASEPDALGLSETGRRAISKR